MTTLLSAPPTDPHRTSLLAGMDPDWVSWLLDTARQRLGMDIAWLSEFTDGQQRIHAATGDLAAMNVHPGMTASLEGSFCVRVLTGQLPPVVTDAVRDPRTRDLAVTEELNIGSYAGAPVRARSGEPVGMLCALSPHQGPQLTQQSAHHLEFLAQLISDHIGGAEPGRPDLAARRQRVLDVLEQQRMDVAFQPVVRMDTGTVVAYEALARFPSTDGGSPATLFGDAAATGLGVELETMALHAVLARLDDRPRHLPIGINLSPAALLRPAVLDLVLDHHDQGIGVELTEHARVEDYTALAAATGALQAAGIVVSIDDAGAGYASLRHILQLRPDVIKLDISLVTDLHHDRPSRRSPPRWSPSPAAPAQRWSPRAWRPRTSGTASATSAWTTPRATCLPGRVHTPPPLPLTPGRLIRVLSLDPGPWPRPPRAAQRLSW